MQAAFSPLALMFLHFVAITAGIPADVVFGVDGAAACRGSELYDRRHTVRVQWAGVRRRHAERHHGEGSNPLRPLRK